MIKHYRKVILNLFDRIHIYRQVHLVYWSKQFVEDQQHATFQQAKQSAKRRREQDLLNAYKAMVVETLQNYKTDIERYRNSIRMDYLLLNFAHSLRNELHSEAQRHLANHAKGRAGTALKKEMNVLIEKAVTSLQHTLSTQHEISYTS